MKTADHTDTDLLAMLRSGSREAFEALYRRHWAALYSTAYKRLKRQDLCKDIVQDVFVDLWNRRAQAAILDLPAYLHTAVRYQVLKQAAKTPVPDFSAPFTSVSAAEQADASILGKEFFNLVDAWLAMLPKKRKKIFRMHYLEDMPTKDIAQQLNISQKTVQNQLGSAWHDLQARLARTAVFILSLLYPLS